MSHLTMPLQNAKHMLPVNQWSVSYSRGQILYPGRHPGRKSLARVQLSRCSHPTDPTRAHMFTMTRIMNKIETNCFSAIRLVSINLTRPTLPFTHGEATHACEWPGRKGLQLDCKLGNGLPWDTTMGSFQKPCQTCGGLASGEHSRGIF